MKYLHNQGQPIATLQSKNRIKRDVSEFVGICKGVIADGLVVAEEVEFIANWLHTHQKAIDQWPLNVVVERLPEIMADGVVYPVEQLELIRLISGITGGNLAGDIATLSTELPFSSPLPDLTINGGKFCVTGTFEFGTRKKVQEVIENKGGVVLPGVKVDLDFLVIGTINSRDWKHNTFGNKIEKAVEYQTKGRQIHIIPESHWMRYVA
ncbi:BRCT domain-containing protein [Chromobacterium rhizoryzae]|uniref:BRCT domain-containing protein n=2 Tax=Chromobacterium TaxID=535 RepID=A0AAD0RXI5_9NEIS|nr:BRCT domain-containing protein [Chromobacterium rhizoryzae]AXT46588.1 hypothetical protein D1345_10485 [Chromobacterium rhizoryzae]